MLRIEEIERLLDENHRLLILDTEDPEGAVAWFQDLDRSTGRACYRWVARDGLRRLSADHIQIPETFRLGDALDYIHSRRQFGVFLFPELGGLIKDLDIQAKIQRHVISEGEPPRIIILYGTHPTLPVRLAPLAQRFGRRRFD